MLRIFILSILFLEPIFDILWIFLIALLHAEKEWIEVTPGVGNKSENPRDPGNSRDFWFWDWDLEFIFKIWDLGLRFGFHFRNLGCRIGIGFENLVSGIGIPLHKIRDLGSRDPKSPTPGLLPIDLCITKVPKQVFYSLNPPYSWISDSIFTLAPLFLYKRTATKKSKLIHGSLPFELMTTVKVISMFYVY